ncbi:hypothetical protein [Paenibacillus taiwanensis]|uniref:hypothetical protein n=1 Tax=Paenibacillus taiwanensis TaxID=401638 RepID=UPI00041EE4B8|nr:hypothetical protein [Paenibacillus taiwanensis]
MLFYGDPQGEYGLRVQISGYLHRFRGCRCTPDQIVVENPGYGQKHDLVIETIQRVFAEKAQIIGKDAGFHILLRIEHTKTEQELVAIAKQADIRITAAAYTWLEPPHYTHKEFLLGFGGIHMDRIVEGVERL